jgi:hypothetical protein
MFFPMAFADHAVAARVHDGAQVFIIVMSLSTREVTCCATFLAVGGELTRSTDVCRLRNKKFDLKLKILVGFYLVFIIRQDLFDLLELVNASQFYLVKKLKSFNKSFKALSFLKDFSGQRQRFGFHPTQIAEEFVKTFDSHFKVGPVEFVRLTVALVWL